MASWKIDNPRFLVNLLIVLKFTLLFILKPTFVSQLFNQSVAFFFILERVSISSLFIMIHDDVNCNLKFFSLQFSSLRQVSI